MTSKKFAYDMDDTKSDASSEFSSYSVRSLSRRTRMRPIRLRRGSIDSLSTVSTIESHRNTSSTPPNYDGTWWAISQPNSDKLRDQLIRYVLKRTVFVYGVDEDTTKDQIFELFSEFGIVNDVISVNDNHFILGTPNLGFGKELTRRYVPGFTTKKSTVFYVLFDSKGGFKKCANQALNNPYFNIFKMDKRLKDFRPSPKV